MNFNLKTVKDIGSSSGTAVVLTDFNVPLKGGKVADNFRIDTVLPTLRFLLEKDFKVVLVSHIGSDGSASLSPVANYLQSFFPVAFVSSIAEAKVKLTSEKVVLLENIRRFPGETENNQALAQELAGLGDIFVNEGFSVSHRAHTSVVGVASILPSFAGLIFEKEIENLARAFEPPRPFVLFLGGNKVETKAPLIQKFLPVADKIFVGGALANAFWKVMGFEIGQSTVSGEGLIKTEWLTNSKIILPKTVAVDRESNRLEVDISEVKNQDRIMDAGKGFSINLKKELSGVKFLIWNGTFGVTEKGFEETIGIAEIITESGADTIVGGGDTVGALGKAGLIEKFSFVSTGGGAMLEFLAKGTLPGIEALKNSGK